jgi:citrate synthase
MDTWRTAIATSDEKNIWVRGYDITALMTRAEFTKTIFLLHQGRLPTATGSRQFLSAAVAACILAIGDEHGGAGSACMELIGSRE